jgi:hypothetical protein
MISSKPDRVPACGKKATALGDRTRFDTFKISVCFQRVSKIMGDRTKREKVRSGSILDKPLKTNDKVQIFKNGCGRVFCLLWPTAEADRTRPQCFGVVVIFQGVRGKKATAVERPQNQKTSTLRSLSLSLRERVNREATAETTAVDQSRRWI